MSASLVHQILMFHPDIAIPAYMLPPTPRRTEADWHPDELLEAAIRGVEINEHNRIVISAIQIMLQLWDDEFPWFLD